MSGLVAVLALARADFFERTRRYQYLATLVGTVIAGIYFVPPPGAPYDAFSVDNFRGYYNSAWIGVMFAMLATTLLSLVGFYLIKSAIEVDRQTRVGEIIATTSVGKFAYCAGKWLSNCAILLSIVGVLVLDGIVMQLIRGEDRSVQLLPLISPFVILVVPVLAVVAAIAVLFETIPFLRGGIGNVVYFFAWVFGLAAGGPKTEHEQIPFWRDLIGIHFIARQMDVALRVAGVRKPSAEFDMVIIGSGGGKLHYFHWTGLTWTASDLLGRAAWFAVAIAILGVAALLFNRFAGGVRTAAERRPNAVAARVQTIFERATAPVVDLVFRSDFGSLILAELRLMLNGLSIWWYAVALGLWIATLTANAHTQSLVLGLAWLWPLLVWSPMGTRETVDDTTQFVYASLHPLRRQFLALWCAGVIVTLATGSGSLLHWALAGNVPGILGVIAGAVFIPSLALACGAVSATTRLFEIVYLMLWYVGPLNNVASIDFTSPHGIAFAGFTACVCLAIAFTGRRLRLASS